jgi:molybdopterin-containing oxidoreductase family membrane subunit
LYRDYLPSSWSIYYRPTIWEVGFYLGTFGLFFTCFFLFAKYFPVIAIAEIKYVLKTTGENFKNDMSTLENKKVDDFIHEMHGDHHAEGSVKVAHH